MRQFILLDNQSSDHVFCNPELVKNIRAAGKELSLHSNGGTLSIKNIADFDGFEESVWFSKQAMTNILSLAMVKLEYQVSYNGDDFIVHPAKHGYTDMVFKPHPSGLHVFDEDDPRGIASYSFVATVEENMSLFTKRQVASAELARNLQAGLAYPSVPDLKWIVQANLLKDSPVTAQDVDVALKIWGPSVALLKGKTVRRKPPLVLEDIVEVPKELRQLHKRVTLTIDIFFVNSAPYFATLSLRICFLSVTHLQNRKIDTIFKALKAMHNYYLQRGFQIVFIKGDGEFKPMEEKVYELYGAPKLNLSSANEHVPEIERKIRVIKERVQAVRYSLPFNALPPKVLIHSVLFVTKQLNLFPVKGGVSAQFSPKQILTGEVVHYKFCSMPFGQYCQISEEDAPRNSLAARTQGAIALGPSGNVQGGHKFWTLNTGSVVVRRDWVVLPMPQSVIDRINSKAKGQPALPIFTDQLGNPIGDTPVDAYQAYEPQESDDNLPGVEIPETEIPGVYNDQADKIPGVDTGSEMPLEPNVDVGVDFESPVPQEMPLVDTSSTQQPEPIQASEGV